MTGETPVRLVEVLGALAVATDLGMGQPPGHAARTCLLADGIAAALDLGPAERAEVFYSGLLRFIGCTADAAEVAAFAGDEIALAAAVAPFVMGEPGEEERALASAGLVAAAAGAGLAPPVGAALGEVKAASMRAHCEAAGMLAARLGLGAGVETALRHGFERWDGSGQPRGLAGEAVPVGTRLAVLARDVELWHRLGGFAAVRETLRARRGGAYHPGAVDAVLDIGEGLLRRVAEDPWQQLLDADPDRAELHGDALDAALEVLADFADAKAPFALGHSRDVAALAGRAAAELGLDAATVADVRRAGLVHDLGRTGVGHRVWARPGRLGVDDWERVRLHPYLTERILRRTVALGPLAELAGAHHERLDGSGYHRGLRARDLVAAQRVLAAADGYQARVQDRPYRPRLTRRAAAAGLADDARAGALDPRAASAVAAADDVRIRVPATWPAGLTDREVDVLRLACRGLSRQAVGQRLGISAKTVSRHLENSYAKIGAGTRAGAALYAVQHGLLSDRE